MDWDAKNSIPSWPGPAVAWVTGATGVLGAALALALALALNGRHVLARSRSAGSGSDGKAADEHVEPLYMDVTQESPPLDCATPFTAVAS